MNGQFILCDAPKGTTVEFAIKTFVAASDPHDIGGHRDRSEVWLNNGGRKYSQVTRQLTVLRERAATHKRLRGCCRRRCPR